MKDEIIKMAREAGLLRSGDGWTEPNRWGLAEIERFFHMAQAAEREACAQVAENMLRFYTQAVTGVPQAIRARGQA